MGVRGLINKLITSTHVLQHDQSDCGVACLLSLIKYYGGNHSLEQLRLLSGTSKQGTTLLGLYQAANQLGFNAEGCEADIQALIDHKQPVILHVVLENHLQHFVVCYSHDEKNGFMIGDPAKGIYYLSAEALDEIWVSKSCLTLEPNEHFITSKSQNSSKKDWFLNLLKPDAKMLWVATVLGIFIAGLGMAMAVFSQKLIDDILPSNNQSKLIMGVILLTVLLLARVGLSVLREYFLMLQTKDFNNRINNDFFNNLLRLPKPFFDTRKIGELVARLNDTQRIQRVIKQLASQMVIDILVVIISMGFLFAYHWRVGIITLVSLPIYFYIIYRVNQKIITAQKDVMQGYALSESHYINSMQGISTIKNQNKQSVFEHINQTIFGFFQEKIFDLGKLNLSLSWQSGLASVFFLMAILIYCSLDVLDKTMPLGELMAVLGIAGGILPSIANLALISIPINEAKIAFERMFEFASMKKEVEDGVDIKSIDHINISQLSFRFAGRKPLFENISITFSKNKIVALVGESGCGKSTIGQILQRFYDFEKGSIKINNDIDLKDVSLNSFREKIGVIPQDITIFNGHVIDNILLGDTNIEELLKFLNDFGFMYFFKQLPQALNTILREEGINLSGGQKQLIGLARAFYKQPELLILDESTSAMDRQTENFCLQLLKNNKSKAIIFFISHRLNTLKEFADEIYILENQSISAFGNHIDLMQTDNFYSAYFQNV